MSNDITVPFPPPAAGSTALDPIQRPDWVICGGPAPHGVYLMASRKLTRAELTYRIEPEMFSIFDGPIRRHHVNTRIVLMVEMEDFVLIHAGTYEDAFTALFQQWRPDDTDQLALGR